MQTMGLRSPLVAVIILQAQLLSTLQALSQEHLWATKGAPSIQYSRIALYYSK